MGNSQSDSDSSPRREPDATDTPRSESYYGMFKMGKKMLVDCIIRPPRAEYSTRELGPERFIFSGLQFVREDLELRNSRGQKIVCSWWQPCAEDRKSERLPCVVYMHGNASCRVEAISALSVVLALGATVFSFDFTGCGMSDGDYISLGHFERDDLQVVTDHLRASKSVSTIGLWGRSMGAATALLHGDRDPSIAGMVLDSPFADLTQLAKELVEHARREGYTIPGFVVSGTLMYINSQVRSKANFELKDVCPEANVDRCFIPALFAHADDDDFILPHHSRQIHDKYAGDKNLISMEGDHASDRPEFYYVSVAIFLRNALRIPDELIVSDDPAHSTPTPPWASPGFYSSFLETHETMDAEFLRQALAQSLQIADVEQSLPPGGDKEVGAGGDVGEQLPEAHSPTPVEPPPLPKSTRFEPREDLVAKLEAMGFSTSAARTALEASQNDVNLALEMLLSA